MNDFQISFKSTSDGWRGKLAQNFTFSNVEQITKAIAIYLIKDLNKKDIVIGYDTRFMSKEFAVFISSVFQKYAIDVTIIDGPSTTPLLAFSTCYYKFPLGINITASHNPPFDDGIKIRMDYGGTPTNKMITKIESYLTSKLKETKRQGQVKFINPRRKYSTVIRKLVCVSGLKNSKVKILVDTMHGATKGLLKTVFDNTEVQVDYLHKDFDPYFGGINPEPKFESTTELQSLIRTGKYDFGIAHDGDGDRIVVVLPGVGYLSPHDVSAILVLYLAKYERHKGNVMGSSTLGRRVKRICDHLELGFETMPVGFKNATESMLKGEILLAAEENGGIGFGFYIPERDTTLAATILVKAQYKVGLKNLLKEVEEIAGRSGFCRYNFLPIADRKILFLKMVDNSVDFNYKKIISIDKSDGIKIIYENDDWLSMRYSGTEDILRIYCESDTREEAIKIKDFAVKKIKNIERKLI